MIAIILLIPSEVVEFNFDLQLLGLLFLWVSSILSLVTAYQYVKISISSNDL